MKIDQEYEDKNQVKDKNKKELDHTGDNISDEPNKEDIRLDNTIFETSEDTEDVLLEQADTLEQKDNDTDLNILDESGTKDAVDNVETHVKAEEINPSKTKAPETTTDDHFIKLKNAITELDGDKQLDDSKDIESDLETSGGKITKHDTNLGHKTHLESGDNHTASESDQSNWELKTNEADNNSDEEFQQKQNLPGRTALYFFCMFYLRLPQP